MRFTVFIVLLVGCSHQSVAPNQHITLDPNQTLPTRSASEIACRDNTHLICKDVIGARIERPLKDCSCRQTIL
jgi:hypothetical protein